MTKTTETEQPETMSQKPASVASHIGKYWRTPNVRRYTRVVGAVVIIVVVFATGVGVGNGRLYFGMFAKTQTGLPATLNYSSVNKVYQLIRTQYDGKITTTQLLDGMKNGLASAVNDPYTEYFTSSQATTFNDELDGTFSGVGVELGQNSDGTLEVIAPLSGSPAAKAGLQSQDLITAINGKTTSGMSADAAVGAIRGPQGSKVTLTVTRGSTTNIEITMTRANIVVPSVTSSVVNGDIGYITINQFSDDTGTLAVDAAQSLMNQKVKGIVLDLRDNPGGLVDAAVDVSSLWLPNNTMIMQEKRGSVVVQTYRANGDDILHGVPTVVLINSGTASAAEITAGALHDNKAATIVGEKSFGKGVVQQLNSLSGGAELKVTIASWYRPDGQNINHVGITPDKTVALTTADVQAGTDPQKAEALTLLQAQ